MPACEHIHFETWGLQTQHTNATCHVVDASIAFINKMDYINLISVLHLPTHLINYLLTNASLIFQGKQSGMENASKKVGEYHLIRKVDPSSSKFQGMKSVLEKS